MILIYNKLFYKYEKKTIKYILFITLFIIIDLKYILNLFKLYLDLQILIITNY